MHALVRCFSLPPVSPTDSASTNARAVCRKSPSAAEMSKRTLARSPNLAAAAYNFPLAPEHIRR